MGIQSHPCGCSIQIYCTDGGGLHHFITLHVNFNVGWKMRGGGQMEHVQDTGNGQSKKREEEEQRKEV